MNSEGNLVPIEFLPGFDAGSNRRRERKKERKKVSWQELLEV